MRAGIVSSGGREGRVASEFCASEDTLDNLSLLFCSPEALLQDRWLDALEKPCFSDRVRAVVVDEAHCISKWYVPRGPPTYPKVLVFILDSLLG